MTQDTREPDPRTLHFGPWGVTGSVPADFSRRLLEDETAWMQLGERVPESVRGQFEKLKGTYRDGLYRYDHFTTAERESYRVLEVALRVRFLEHYDLQVPLVVNGQRKVIPVQKFDDVRQLVSRRRTVLQGHRRFNGSLSGLLHWARAVGYLRGQRNRIREKVTPKLRNEVQHSEFDFVFMPPDAIRSIALHFQWIQRLWGYDTPMGDSYPGPLPRYLWALGLGPEAGEATWLHLDGIAGMTDRQRDSRSWCVVLAGKHERLSSWHPGFDCTALPVDAVWGPGPWEDLCAAVEQNHQSWLTDYVEILDREFFIRTLLGSIELPRSAAQVAALRDRHRDERWGVIRADFPGMAMHHLSGYTTGPHAEHGPCPSCAVEVVMSGARRETIDRYVLNRTGQELESCGM
ncbi:MAG TPA: hypothetical protein VN193_11105 [Candidatus Angelobacter sp.]|jgi:hypothetical protein|nr:hypothetical protein [Candidatus Angelobacter sp.]